MMPTSTHLLRRTLSYRLMRYLLALALIAGPTACGAPNTATPSTASALGPSAAAPLPVAATVETIQVPHEGDAADDPAIWVHPSTPALSIVIGTDKKGGLAVYDLDGQQLQYLPDGNLNNVDIRTGFSLGGRSV